MPVAALQTWRTIVPVFWMGAVFALAFIETPLKFLAPGMTLPVALGVGRLVLTAANIIAAVLLVILTILSLVRVRVGRGALATLAGLWVVLAVQVLVIRPPLNARSDLIIAGGDPGHSSLHVVYIVTDLIMLALLLAYVVLVNRRARGAAGIIADTKPAAAKE